MQDPQTLIALGAFTFCEEKAFALLKETGALPRLALRSNTNRFSGREKTSRQCSTWRYSKCSGCKT